MRLSIVLVLFMATACASKPNCADALFEPVSVCRAEVACGKGTWSYNVSALNPDVRRQHEACIDRQLSAQKASMGVKTREVSCTSYKDGDETKTDCRER